jgi:hypothetical protein
MMPAPFIDSHHASRMCPVNNERGSSFFTATITLFTWVTCLFAEHCTMAYAMMGTSKYQQYKLHVIIATIRTQTVTRIA